MKNNLFNFILYFIKPYRNTVILIALLAIFSGLYGIFNSYLTKLLINAASQPIINNELIWLAIFFVMNFELHNLSWRGINYLNRKLFPDLKKDIIGYMFDYTTKHSSNFFQNNFSGTIASNITRVAENSETIVNTLFTFIIRGILQLIFALIAMYYVNVLFSFALGTWTVVFMLISLGASKKIKLLSDQYADSNSLLSGKVNDAISNIGNIRLFARENFENQLIGKAVDEVNEKYRAKEGFLLKLWWVQGKFATLLIAVMLFILIRLKNSNQVSAGDFALILGMTLYISDNVWWLTDQIDRLNDAIGQCKQQLNRILIPHEINDAPDALNLQVTKGEIVFDKVNFNYKDNSLLLNEQSIILYGGQKVGLVGFSGSGKTTFINLIVRLFEISAGRILIDNQNISEVTQKSLRENISFISQDPVLFHRSLMENIRYGKPSASDAQVIEAAKLADADEFIKTTPGQYESLVGERGVKLSGGQRQRIAIARAILKDAPILILDEATSALDSVTEKYIQNNFIPLMKDKTVIVVAHRLSSLLAMDRILVFDQGKIIEEGTHVELIKKGGTYTTLWENQKDGFLQ